MNRRRTSAMVMEQGLQSGTAFVLTSALARSSSAQDFGVLVLLLSIGITALPAIQALAGDAIFLDAERDSERISAGLSLGFAAGFLISAGLLASTPLWPNEAHIWVVLAALAYPGLVLADLLRYPAVIGGGTRVLLMLRGATLLVLLALAVVSPKIGPAWTLVGWGVSAAVVAIVGLTYYRQRIHPRAGLHFLRNEWGRATPMVGEAGVVAAGQQAQLWIVGSGGTELSGAYRALQTLFGPVNILHSALRVVVLSEYRQDHRHLRRIVAAVAALLAVSALAFGVVAWLLMKYFGDVIFGAAAALMTPALVPYALSLAALGLATGPFIGLRALGRTGASMNLRAAATILIAVGCWVGVHHGGLVGSVIGVGIATAVFVPVWWAAFLLMARADEPAEMSATT